MSFANEVIVGNDERIKDMINRKRPQRNIIIKTNKFAKVWVKSKRTHTLCENELILSRWSGSRIDKDVKLIWFNEHEEMIYSDRHRMNFPKCYIEYLEELCPTVTEEEKEQQREEQERWNKVHQKQMEQERLKEAREKEQAFCIINAHHQKCKNEVKSFLVQLEDDSDLWFELCHLDNQKWSKEEMLIAVEDIPLFVAGIKIKGGSLGQDVIDWEIQKLISSKLNDNRNAQNGKFSEECWECYKQNKHWAYQIRETTPYYVNEFIWSQYKK